MFQEGWGVGVVFSGSVPAGFFGDGSSFFYKLMCNVASGPAPLSFSSLSFSIF